MNYPIWELESIGGGSLIALISILHVYIAHLAVGGGAFLLLADRKGYRDNSVWMHDYVRRHTLFFLLLTMVFGGVTGVGIWFIIALVHPAATSSLIHNFVFGWAIEWVFFLGEITALLVYHYRFDALGRRQRLTVAFLYFLFAWLSLFIINGILSFMLTPGAWLENHAFWSGFFNPTFLPSLIFRTCMALMIAGLFGYVTAVFTKDMQFRQTLLRWCSRWLLYPVIVAIPAALWYYGALPDAVQYSAFDLNRQIIPFQHLFLTASVLLFLAGIYFSLRGSQRVQKVAVFVVVLIGLGWMGGFEYMREIARKPWVIAGFMYSTSIQDNDLARYADEGVLANARWSAIHEITDENRGEAGAELFRLQCLSCHTIGGIRNDILPRTAEFSFRGMVAQLAGQGRTQTYMPPFAGTEEEMDVLAEYIIGTLHGKEIVRETEAYEVRGLSTIIPPFDASTDDYVLLAWNDLGMHCLTDCDQWFVILPPANTIEAQLIRRGARPAVVQEGVTIEYAVEDGFVNPSAHVPFWRFSSSTFGTELKANVGLFGYGLSGTLRRNPDRGGFIAEAVPVVPYPDRGGYNPYPQFLLTAKDAGGKVLARTRVVAPVSTEMGCRNCHGGDWRLPGVGGVSDETAINILKAHDRLSGTDMLGRAENGAPVLCQSCHADPALGAEGNGMQLNLSASMHGWHANYMDMEDGSACAMCHPAASNGRTRCNRGIHSEIGLECTDCHGSIDDHAASLLKGESAKRRAGHLIRNLRTVAVEDLAAVKARTPWVQQPDCLGCHREFQQPEMPLEAFNHWNSCFSELYRIRRDNAGVRCEACHNSTHAIYPTFNAYGVNRDNTQPLQYGGMPYPIGSDESCAVCHRQKMAFSLHHKNTLRSFRNRIE